MKHLVTKVLFISALGLASLCQAGQPTEDEQNKDDPTQEELWAFPANCGECEEEEGTTQEELVTTEEETPESLL